MCGYLLYRVFLGPEEDEALPARIAAVMSEVVTGLSVVLHHVCRSVRRAVFQFSSEGEEVDRVKEKITQVNNSLSRSVIQSNSTGEQVDRGRDSVRKDHSS